MSNNASRIAPTFDKTRDKRFPKWISEEIMRECDQLHNLPVN